MTGIEAFEAALTAARTSARAIRSASRHQADLVRLLQSAGRREEAIAELADARDRPTGAPEDYEALGFAAYVLGEHALARQFYQRVVDAAPKDATALYNLATSERNVGDLDAADVSSTRALALDPGLVDAALLRSHLRTQSAEDNHVAELQALLTAPGLDPRQAIFLHYSLGKEFDDLGDYDRAFSHFDKGAKTRRHHLQYDVVQDLGKLARIKDVFGPDFLSVMKPAQPVRHAFIVGLPRSGTTLIERVITGNPRVRANGETDNFLGALMEGIGDKQGDIFEKAAGADFAIVAAAYARRAGLPDPGGVVVEKLPLNYLYAGLIASALPDARLLLLTRCPADNCLAMFTTLFGNAYPFSYDLVELGRYYVAYRSLATHWVELLGDRILEVPYEAFVKEPVVWGQRVTKHLDLPWDDKFTAVESNRSPSSTASAAQVRRPIYRSAVHRWHNYKTHLAPLAQVLSDAGIDPDG